MMEKEQNGCFCYGLGFNSGSFSSMNINDSIEMDQLCIINQDLKQVVSSPFNVVSGTITGTP